MAVSRRVLQRPVVLIAACVVLVCASAAWCAEGDSLRTFMEKSNTVMKWTKLLTVIGLVCALIWAAVEHGLGDEQTSKGKMVKVVVTLLVALLFESIINFFIAHMGGVVMPG